MKKKYSIAIYPPSEVMGLVKNFKDLLASSIGWYNSRNTKAHITIIEFEANDQELVTIKNFLERFCNTKSPFQIHLDGFKKYLNGAFYISPDEDSKRTTKGFMKQLHADFPLKSLFKSTDPHMSIARELDKQDIKIADYLFQELKADFNCDSVVLREFNPDIKQFVVVEKYLLKGSEDLPYAGGQLSLGF